eukprot:3180020-Amphidinium_carterae.1
MHEHVVELLSVPCLRWRYVSQRRAVPWYGQRRRQWFSKRLALETNALAEHSRLAELQKAASEVRLQKPTTLAICGQDLFHLKVTCYVLTHAEASQSNQAEKQKLTKLQDQVTAAEQRAQKLEALGKWRDMKSCKMALSPY